MRKTECHLLAPHAKRNEELAIEIIAVLQKIDTSLSVRLDTSVGATKGERLIVKWATAENGQMLAIEVLDTQTHHQWELGIAPLPDSKSVVFRRSTWKGKAQGTAADDPDPYDQLWRDLIQTQTQREQFHSRQEPHFMALVAASCSVGGINVIKDDAATINSLQLDNDYWMGLAKSTNKLLKEAQSNSKQIVKEYTSAAPEIETPPIREWKLNELDQWAALNSDKIVVLPRAISAAKRSHYKDPALVYQCLELLANEYTDLKKGRADRNAYKEKADQLGLQYGGSVDPSVAGEQGEEYFIRWRGRRRFLDQHVTKGSARDPRFTMRIYFTWDDESEQVIIGWLPSHLGTSTS